MSENGGIEWGTVERSDEALHVPTPSESESVLEVPALSDMDIERTEREYLQQETPPPLQTGVPNSSVECETCGKTVRVRKDGQLSSHKCDPKPQRGNRLDDLPQRKIVTPTKVRKFGIALIAYGVEEGAASLIARPFGADPDDVPSELPDAEGMIGPPLDLLWPSIPKAAQDFIGKLADNADLIDCALAWADWLNTLRKWTNEQRRVQNALLHEREAHATSQPEGSLGYGTVVPFQPGG